VKKRICLLLPASDVSFVDDWAMKARRLSCIIFGVDRDGVERVTITLLASVLRITVEMKEYTGLEQKGSLSITDLRNAIS
jgi:hypothetical protein